MNKLVMMILVVAACDGGSGGSGPLTSSDATDVCNDTCSHDQMCNPDNSLDACVSDCVAQLGGGGVRSDAVNAIADCIVAQACTATDDTCLTECQPTSAHDAFETKCRAKIAECGGTGSASDECETTPNGTDDDIGYSCLFTPAVMDALSACLDQDCTAIGDCYQSVLTQYGLSN